MREHYGCCRLVRLSGSERRSRGPPWGGESGEKVLSEHSELRNLTPIPDSRPDRPTRKHVFRVVAVGSDYREANGGSPRA